MTNELSMTRGDSTTFRLTVMNNSSIMNIAGYDGYLTIKKDRADPDSEAIIGPVTGSLVTDGSDGLIDFEITTELSSVAPDTYSYDVELVKDDNTVTPISSTFTITLDDTRALELEDQSLYVTPEELRKFLQYDINDYPSPDDMRFFIKLAMKKIALDIDSSDENILFIATLLLSKTYVLRSLASRSIKTGYVQVNAEGRTITKAYQEYVLDAENSLQEYKEFMLSVDRRETTSTNFLTDTTLVDSWTRTYITQVLNGTSNAIDAQSGYKGSYFWRRT